MRVRSVLVVAVLGLVSFGLAGCFLIPPSPDDVAGTYVADGATVVVDADGTCEVANYPGEIDVDDDGGPVFGEARLDSACTWEVGRLLYSGMWELNVVLSRDGDNLYLSWLSGCLARSLGDPDQGDLWELCPA